MKGAPGSTDGCRAESSAPPADRGARGPASSPPDTLLGRFDRVAAARPAAVAVRAGGRSAGYGVLAEASHLLADGLAARIRGRSGPVAVLGEPGPGQVLAALAAMRCGKPYLPIDPAYPRRRVERVLADAAPAAVIGTADTAPGATAAGWCDTDIPLDVGTLLSSASVTAGTWGDSTDVTADDAYVIYTSGSSGAPKGIVIRHQGLLHLLDAFDGRLALPPGSRHGACASPGFDAGVWETWTSLNSGGELCVVPENRRWDATGFADWLADHRVANAYVPAAFLPALAGAARLGVDLSSLRRVMAGAEPISRGVLGEVKRALPGLTLLNAYGPTEATVCCLAYEVTAADTGSERAPIGTPIGRTDLRVEAVGGESGPVDGESGPVDVGGTVGELHVGGPGVGRYLRPEPGARPTYYRRTSPAGPGCPYYRTGDLVRRDAAGTYTFLGRIDSMVKIRGYRVEPHEVEHTLLRLPDVAEAVVLRQTVPGAAPGDRERLVAHLVPASGARLDLASVRRRLGERLPWYAVPSGFEAHTSLPLTEHGKVDRRALAARNEAAPEARRAAPAERPAPPSASGAIAEDTSDGGRLRALWTEALGANADPDASFLDNGGHSLAAGGLAAAVAERMGRRVRMVDVLLAGGLDELEQAVRRGERITGPAAGRRHGPLSPAQQGMVLEEQLWGVEGAYAESCLFVLPRAVGPGALCAAVTEALARHPALGGRVEGALDPSSAVLRLGRSVDVRTHRLGAVSPGAADLAELADLLRREPLDLESGPLARAHLLTGDEGCVALLLTVHHAVCDTWSLRLLLRDVERAYEGAEQPPEPTATVCDHAGYEQGTRSEAAVARRAGALARLVPGGEREPYPSASTRVVTVRTGLADETADRTRRAAARAGTTGFTVVCAAFERALASELGLGRFLYATSVARRDDPRFAGVAGCLVNTVPVASSAPSTPVARILPEVREALVSALSAAHLPYSELTHALRLRGVHRTPHRFMVVHDSPLRLRLDGRLSTGVTLAPIVARSDVWLSVTEDRGSLAVDLHLDGELFTADDAHRLLGAFEDAVRTLAAVDGEVAPG